MMSLKNLAAKGADADLPWRAIGSAAERLMEMEVGALTGAGESEMSAKRLLRRNGYRERDCGVKRTRKRSSRSFPAERPGRSN